MVFASNANNGTNTNVNSDPQTTILILLQQLLPLNTYWISDQNTMAGRVAYARRMYEGDHDANLTKEMMANLRIKDQTIGLTVNMMPTVVDTKVDRCIVQGIEGVEDVAEAQTEQTVDTEATVDEATAEQKKVISASTAWAQEVMDNVNFDAIQGDLMLDTIRDGNGYLMVAWDNVKKQVAFTVEPAWDGSAGVIMVYRSHQIKKPYAAIKIWQIEDTTPQLSTVSDGSGQQVSGQISTMITTRCNIYYEDRIEKYISRAFAPFEKFNDEGNYKQPWVMGDGTPIGIPIVHFRNAGRENYGVSEMRNAWGPQSALDRFHYSAVMAAELTAFSIYKVFGLAAPAALTPGMVINIETQQTSDYQPYVVDKLDGTDIKPILDMIDSERRLIAEITRTPSPDLAAGSGSNKSGEFLKQLEVGLIGKVKRFTTHAGSSWEQVFDLAWLIQKAYGTMKPPAYKRWLCHWMSPEIRNDQEVVANAMLASPVFGPKQTMLNMAQVYDLDEEKIDKILDDQMKADVAKAQAMQAAMPTDSVNTASGKVGVTEAPQTIGPGGQVQQPAGNAPAIKGAKLPPDQALKVNPITPEELAAVGAMHRKAKGAAA